MNMKKGSIIALSWPETKCKQAGAWYDPISSFIGLSKDGYYKVGHAALVLVNHETGECRYFDFGRYHAPEGHGRVRSAETDHDLRMTTVAEIDRKTGRTINMQAILSELFSNPSTHGDGEIFGVTIEINHQKTLNYILELQDRDHIEYGPFIPSGTNCSRFVSSSLLAGNPSLRVKLGLYFPLTISPTPMWNLIATGSRVFSFDGTLLSQQEPLVETLPALNLILQDELILEEVPIPISTGQ